MITQGAKLASMLELPIVSNGSSNTLLKAKDGKSFSDMLSDSTTNKVSTVAKKASTVNQTDNQHSIQKDIAKSMTSKTEVSQIDKSSNTNSVDQSVSNLEDDVAKVMNDVKEAIQDSLGISEEELVRTMEVLGLSMIDLLNPESLQQLVLATSGNDDILSFVTNEELSNTYSDLLETIQGIVNESNIPLDVTSQVTKSEEFLGELDQTIIKEELAKANQTTQSNTDYDVTEESEGIKDSEANLEIAFSVERSSDSDDISDSTNQSEKDSLKKSDSSQVENFLNHVSNVTQTETDFDGQLTTVTTVRDIANQIIEEIKVVIKPSQTSMELQLNPEHLGKVQLTLTSKEGLMTAQFTTQTQMAKEAIESQMQVLKQNLENQGVRVEAIEVNVSNFSFSGSNEAGNKQESNSNKGKKAFRMEAGNELEGTEEVLPTQTVLLGETVPNIDYSA